jgi:hypothetical protein
VASKGYTTATKVALLLGTDGYAALSVNQADRMSQGLIEAAENWIDAYTGRAWLTGGTVTGERHPIENARVWLKQRPITAVTAVRIGGRFETLALLTVTTDYVVEVSRGLITFRGYSRSEVEVDYTVPQTVPADVAEAAGQIVAEWLRLGASSAQLAAASAAAGAFKSVRVDDEELVYRDARDLSIVATLPAVPATVEKLLGRYRQPVLA